MGKVRSGIVREPKTDITSDEQLKIICKYIVDEFIKELRQKEEKHRIKMEKRDKKSSKSKSL